MNRIFTILIAFATISPAICQETPSSIPDIPEPVQEITDTSEVRLSGKKIIVISDKTHRDEEKTEKTTRVVSVFATGRNRVWQGFEIGFTGVSYTPDFNTTPTAGAEFFNPNVSNSINWGINPFELDVRIVNEYVKFSTGLGYTVKNFSLSNNYRLTKDPNGVITGYVDTVRTLERSRFRTGYITAPLMLHFNTSTNPSRSVRVGVGVVGGIDIFQAYRVKHYENGHKTREKYNGGFEANPFLLDIRGVVGYGGVNLFATYSTLGLFKSNMGPEVYPFTVGIAFVNNY